MNAEDIRIFACRDWKRVAAAKSQRWVEAHRTMSPSDALTLAERLRQHALSLYPDWPSAEERKADIDLHTNVSKSLQRVRRS